MIELFLRAGGTAKASAWRMLAAALALLCIGILVQILATTHMHEDPDYYVVRQIRNGAAAILVGGAAFAFGFRRFVRISPALLACCWIALAGLLITRAGHSAGGSTRWYDLGPVHFQPSELTKVVLIVFFAGYCARRKDCIGDFRRGFLPAMGVVALSAILILMAPDFGQTVFVLASCSMVLLLNGVRASHLFLVLALGLPVLVAAVSTRWQYFLNRVSGFLEGSHYQVEQGLKFLAAGGRFGRPPGDVHGQLFVPEIRNDFALVTAGEQGGFIACLAIACLFLLIFFHGLRIAFLARDSRGFTVAIGLVTLLVMQAAVNMAVVANLVPPKGVSLPFVSYGGSNMLVGGLALGLIASVARDGLCPGEALAKHAAASADASGACV